MSNQETPATQLADISKTRDRHRTAAVWVLTIVSLGLCVLFGWWLWQGLPATFYTPNNTDVTQTSNLPTERNGITSANKTSQPPDSSTSHGIKADTEKMGLLQALIAYLLCLVISVIYLLYLYIGKNRSSQLDNNEDNEESFFISHSFQLVLLLWGVIAYFAFTFGSLRELAEHAKNLEIFIKLGEATMLAAFVSLVFDVALQESNYTNLLNTFEGTNHQITAANKHVQTLTDNVHDLINILAYEEFRKEVLEEYGNAQFRITSLSDNWSIDEEWWKNPKEWGNTTLFKKLMSAYGYNYDLNGTYVAKDQFPHLPEIIFAGSMPQIERETRIFSNDDCELFLGVMWRIVIAHKVRNRIRELSQQSKDIPLRIKCAKIPFPVTIVDNSVWLVLPSNEDGKDTERAFHYTGKNPGAGNETEEIVEIANKFDSQARDSLRHARSAREHIQSALLAAMYSTDYPNTLEQKLYYSTINNLLLCMQTLGIKTTAGGEGWYKNTIEDNDFVKAITELANAFAESLESSFTPKTKADITFLDLVEDMS